MPEAQLDRFFFKLEVGYSTRADLREILARTTAGTIDEPQKVIDAETIIRHQKLVRAVRISDAVQDYAVRVVLATHPRGQFATPLVNQFLRFGASPRAAQTMVLGAKVKALLGWARHRFRGRHQGSGASRRMRHRVLLNFEAEAEGRGCG